jgi:hypothetical protein
LDSATSGFLSSVNADVMDIYTTIEIVVSEIGKEDDPPCLKTSHEDFTEDRQDDTQTDCGSGSTVGSVSQVVRGLLRQV